MLYKGNVYVVISNTDPKDALNLLLKAVWARCSH